MRRNAERFSVKRSIDLLGKGLGDLPAALQQTVPAIGKMVETKWVIRSLRFPFPANGEWAGLVYTEKCERRAVFSKKPAGGFL